MADITYMNEVSIDFGIPCEKMVDGKLNPMCRDDLTDEEISTLTEKQLRAVAQWRQNRSKLQDSDPVTYGWTLDRWRAVSREWKDHSANIIYGGNRSSKSSYSARVAVYIAMTVPGAEIVCWSVDETSSINDQQRFIYEALPKAYRNMSKVKGKMFSVQYSQKNGFSGNKLIIPSIGDDASARGSSIIFKNYRSYQLNPQVAEGWKAHFIWLDEECPSTLFETMRKRLWDYKGRLFLTFTTLQGWTSLINNINSKAVDKKRRYADRGKPPRYVPYEQMSVNEDKCKIWYFWTQDNPFIPFKEAVDQVSVRPDDEIMARLYGVCTKSSTTKFPKFNRNVHVIKHDNLPWIKDKGTLVTRYQTLDPAGKKKWFFIYAGVTHGVDDDMPNIYIYDEFPDWSYGAWGLTDETPKGKPGPGQKGLGTGIKGYKSIMESMEGTDEIFERGIDKRFANSTYSGMDGDTRLLDQLMLVGLRYVTPQVKRVDKINEIELGCQSINDYLDYDEHQDVSILNSPHLYISERCMNLIECMENFTGEGGDTEIWKDGIDTLRILMDINPRVVDFETVYSGRKGARGY